MPIVYYDGNCVYCYNYCIWLIQHGLPKNYEFAMLKGEAGKHLFKQHPEAKNKNSVILQEGDRLYYETTAVAKLITTLSSKKWLGILLRVMPLPIRNLGYRLFANNRDKMWKTHWHKPNAYEKSFFIDDDRQ